jgi:hypothetical protein
LFPLVILAISSKSLTNFWGDTITTSWVFSNSLTDSGGGSTTASGITCEISCWSVLFFFHFLICDNWSLGLRTELDTLD